MTLLISDKQNTDNLLVIEIVKSKMVRKCKVVADYAHL